MERDYKEKAPLTADEARELLLAHMKTIRFKKKCKIYVSDLIRQDEWGYYFYTGPYETDDPADAEVIRGIVEYNGKVAIGVV